MILRSLLSSGFKWLLLCLLVLVALAGAARWLPELLVHQPERVEALLSDRLGHPVRLTDLSAHWQGSGLTLTARDVQVLTPDGPAIHADGVQVTLWPLQTLWRQRPVLRGLAARNLQARLIRTATGDVTVAGLPEVTVPAQMLAGLPKAARHTLAGLFDGEGAWALDGVTAGFERRGSRWRATATATLPDRLAQQVRFVARGRTLDGRVLDGGGRFYLGLEAADLAAAGPWLPLDLSGRAGGDLWGWWRSGQIRHLAGQIQVRDPGLAYTAADPAASIQLSGTFLNGRFRWQRTESGNWVAQIERLGTDLGGPAWTVDRLALGRATAASGTRWGLATDALDLASLERLVRPFDERLPQRWQHLADLAPWGGIDGLRLRLWQPAGTSFPQIESVRAEVRGIGWAGGPEKWPRVTGLTGTLWALPDAGAFQPASRDLAVHWPERFPNLSLGAVRGTLAWQKVPQGWYLAGRQLSLTNPSFAGRLHGDLWLPAGGGKPWVALRAGLRRGDVAAVRDFLPERGMPEKARDWLRKSLQAGQVTGGLMTMRGWLDHFPFEQGDGVFRARLNVQDGQLAYHSEWPRIEAIDATVRFQGAALTVDARQARIFDYEVARTQVRIPELRRPVVQVRGQGSGPLPDLLRFLRESPLAERYGALLRNVQSDGGSRLDLALDVDVKAKQATVDGNVTLAAGSVHHQSLNLSLEGLQGGLAFSERGLATQGLTGTMLGGSVTLDIARPSADGQPTVVEAAGRAAAPALALWLGKPLPWLAGEAAWQGRLTVAREAEQTAVDLTVESDLAGLEVDLPAPAGKPAEALRPLQVRMQMAGTTPGTAAIEYGDALQLSLARGMEGWAIRGHLAHLPVRDWLPVLAQGLGTAGKDGALPAVHTVALDVARLAVGQQRFTNTRIRATRLSEAWRMRAFDGRQELILRIPERINGHTPLAVRLNTLEFGDLGGMTGTGSAGLPGPADLPPLSVRVDRLTYRQQALGELNLQLRPTEGGIRLQELRLDGDVVHLEGDGHWLQRPNGEETRWRWMLVSGNFGALLDRLGVAAVIKEGSALLESTLHWPGSPGAFDMGRLNGDLKVRVADGRLVEVEPGVGRVFGLLSLQALPRRLALDFSDVFQEGFSFGLLEGGFQLENGQASTENTVVNGPAAEIRIRGRTDLVQRLYNQRITVIPKTGTGVPIVGAIAANPAVGLALWMVGELLNDPVGQAMRREYRVTGPWQKPEIEQISGNARGQSAP